MNCYNGERFLQESIKSVLSQTYENWELIFWDNQSNDKSAEIFKSFNDKRLKYYFAEKHTLLSEARNEAIKKTTGEFIAFLDTDDCWERDKLELQLPLFNNSEVGVVYGNLFVVNEKFKTKKIYLRGKKPKGFILESLLKNYCTLLVTLVIRKSFLENYKPAFDHSFHIAGDFDLIIRMSVKHKFDCVEKPIASYRVHEKNESLINRGRQINELKKWYDKMVDYPAIFNNKNFLYINCLINNFEIVNLILKNDIKTARIKIKKMPYSLKKIKYLLALFLPNNFVKRFI
jgi:glycosyltransferase involved in cell wall biosynthesis